MVLKHEAKSLGLLTTGWASWRPSGQQRERVDVRRADHGEVPAIQGGDLADTKSLGDRHDAGVDAANVEIAVVLDQLGDAFPVADGESSTARSPAAMER